MRPVPARRPASRPGLDLPGAVDPTGPAMLRTLGTVLFLVGSLGALVVLVIRRPSGGGMRPA